MALAEQQPDDEPLPEFLFKWLNWLTLLSYGFTVVRAIDADQSETIFGSFAIYFGVILVCCVPHALVLGHIYLKKLKGIAVTLIFLHIVFITLASIGFFSLNPSLKEVSLSFGDLITVCTLLFNPVYLVWKTRRFDAI